MTESTPQARAAAITYHLLLRQWERLVGLSTAECADRLGMSWSGCHSLLRNLSAYEELPVFRTPSQVWYARFEPRALEPPEECLTPQQRASLVTHRLIVRDLLDEKKDGLSRGQIAVLVGITPGGATKLMEAISELGGAPVYSYLKRWYMEMIRFESICRIPTLVDVPGKMVGSILN